MNLPTNKSPEPTAVGAPRSAVAVPVASQSRRDFTIIARRFNAGKRVRNLRVPKGRLK
jgi:hypothetical protein